MEGSYVCYLLHSTCSSYPLPSCKDLKTHLIHSLRSVQSGLARRLNVNTTSSRGCLRPTLFPLNSLSCTCIMYYKALTIEGSNPLTLSPGPTPLPQTKAGQTMSAIIFPSLL